MARSNRNLIESLWGTDELGIIETVGKKLLQAADKGFSQIKITVHLYDSDSSSIKDYTVKISPKLIITALAEKARYIIKSYGKV